MNAHALFAVARRQLGSFLANPLGYIFMLAFVALTGVLLFREDEFFQRGVADLWFLPTTMPVLLCAFVPALAMGAWTSEREQGTDELVLTLPMTTADAVLGKYLAIAAFFTLAMVANVGNVIVLMTLGTPDLGLMASNYIGWWLCGLAFAAVGLLASVCVRSQAIAFVLGVIGSALLATVGYALDWMDPFANGLLSLGSILSAIGAIIIGIGLSIVLLSARLWQAERSDAVGLQVANLLLAVALAVNLGRIASLTHVDADLSVDGISSIGAGSEAILEQVETPVEITLFISHDDVLRNLPKIVERKAKDVITIAKAVERNAGGTVTLRILRPTSATDPKAIQAEKEFELSPREIEADTIAGKDMAEVYLSAVITSRDITHKIPYFDPGLPIEYELVSAVRAVDLRVRKALPVLGVVTTEITMTEDFDYQRGQPIPAWQVIEELRKQYDVRSVDLGGPLSDDIDVLMVPMPSGLTQEELTQLHDWIWAGNPTLLLEDPFPFTELRSGRYIAPALPRWQGQPGMQQQQPPPKGDIISLYAALGLRFDPLDMLWSDHLPSRDMRHMDRELVWSSRVADDDDGLLSGIRPHPATEGIDLFLSLYPGAMFIADDAADSLTHTPMISPNASAHWGRKQFENYLQMTPYGPTAAQDRGMFRAESGTRPLIAVQVTGKMPRAFAAATDAPAEGEEGATEAPAAGTLSNTDINVIVLADLDAATNTFYEVYRGIDQRSAQEAYYKLLASLGNVQLLANVVDVLADESDFLAVRARRPSHRPLTAIVERIAASEKVVNESIEAATKAVQDKIQSARDAVQARVDELNKRTDLDTRSKMQQLKMFQDEENNRLNNKVAKIEAGLKQQKREIRAEQQADLRAYLRHIKILAIGIPAIFLMGLVLVVTITRVARERTDIPASRKRGAV